MRLTTALLATAALVAAAGCGSGTTGTAGVHTPRPRQTTTASGGGPTSIVQLGDSIASGEGTYYGYTYDPDTGKWAGGDLNVMWDPPYNGCHDASYAYVHSIAAYYTANPPKVAQFACTGATFANGISAPEVSDGTQLRPAEFGNWDTKQNLNPDYDAAKPDLVLVTLGADDVQFVSIVEDCIENGYESYFHLATLACVNGNPGSTIQKDFLNYVPTLEQNYKTLVKWIEERAQADGTKAPKIVFTTYPSPLPPDGGPNNCPDENWLYQTQVAYLSTLVTQLNHDLTSTLTGLKDPNVAVADVSGAYTPTGENHRWCQPDPWAYGLSIYSVYSPSSFKSQAPFHPTPAGQASIANYVIPTLLKLFGGPLPSSPTSSPTTAPSTTSSAPSSTTTSSSSLPSSATTAAPG
jgi:lysophospholipase L1-like esterase